MPINRVKDSEGRSRFEFEFSRRIDGRRVRVRKLLPAAWGRPKADAFDIAECGRLYAESTGVQEQQHTIDQAVARFNADRAPYLKDGPGRVREVDLMSDYFTGHPLGDLPQVCAKYLKDHRAKLAPATIKNRLRYLTAACRYAWKHCGMGKHDPAAAVAMPAVSNQREVYLDRADMLLLAQACRDRAVRAMIRIAFYSGMRKAEIMRAKVAGDVWTLGKTKNGKPRVVPMHPRCRPYVAFKWPSKGMVTHRFNEARYAVDMEHVTFHDLRHSAASAMINQGVDLYTVGGVLGHKSSASTQRYAHLATHSLRDAVGRIGKRA